MERIAAGELHTSYKLGFLTICWEFDADQEQARESRLRIMALAADNKYYIAGAHLDSPGVGRISRLENRFRFDPLYGSAGGSSLPVREIFLP